VKSVINTHGFEKEENEHDINDKIYPELSPMLNPTGMVRILRNRAGFNRALSERLHYDLTDADFNAIMSSNIKMITEANA
jgi:predicted translin family RNA/ssDNA-binding protein